MFQKLTRILSGAEGNSAITSLVSKARLTERYQNIFMKAVPDDLQPHIRFAALDNGLITAVTTNAVFATQLRILQGEVLAKLREHSEFRYAYKIRIKVTPVNLFPDKRKAPLTISQTNADLLFQEARLCDDEDIADALAALASHAKN